MGERACPCSRLSCCPPGSGRPPPLGPTAPHPREVPQRSLPGQVSTTPPQGPGLRNLWRAGGAQVFPRGRACGWATSTTEAGWGRLVAPAPVLLEHVLAAAGPCPALPPCPPAWGRRWYAGPCPAAKPEAAVPAGPHRYGGSCLCILQCGSHSTDVWGRPPPPLPLLSAWPSPARVSAAPTGEGGLCPSSGPSHSHRSGPARAWH